MQDFEVTMLSGTSVRFTLADVVDLDNDDVTSLDTISINLYDNNDEIAATGTVVADPVDENTWYTDIILPTVTRTQQYRLKAAAEKSTVQLREFGIVWVAPF